MSRAKPKGDPPRDETERKRSASAVVDPPRARGRATRNDPTEQYRDIQRGVDRADKQKEKKEKKQGKQEKGAAQAGVRKEPEPPLPKQHLEKPGIEVDLELRPNYMAPEYKGSGKLQDMVAIITGGDSGIGRAVAVLYAREGADVALVYLPSEDVDAQETREAVEREGRRCLLIPGDVSDYDFCEEAVERTVRELGKLDILVNNAAFQEHAQDIDQLSLEHFDRTIKTNLYGYFHMAKAAVPYLRQGSAIVNTGSVTGLRGSPDLLDYSMTKGGIHAFTRSLSTNLIEKGIRVNAVAPGPVWTPLNPADKRAEDVAQFGAKSDMGRPAQPEEISPAYVFLASPVCSGYVNGIILPVMGGPRG
jgi:NAD(P)-dependent dehydrogenase (short-subunit alcohol dehydrogenase family)